MNDETKLTDEELCQLTINQILGIYGGVNGIKLIAWANVVCFALLAASVFMIIVFAMSKL